MECKFCGANLEDNENFCPECGKALNEEETLEEKAYTDDDEVTESEIPEDIPEFSEDFEDTDAIDELEAIDGSYDEEIDEFNYYETDETGKTSAAFKIVSIVVVLALLICGSAFAYFKLTANKDILPVVYTVQENNLYGSYVYKTGMKEPILLSSSEKALFSQYSDFVLNEKFIYYINSDNALYALKFGKNSAVKLADNAQKQGLVLSSDGKKLLYTTTASEGEGYDLYLYNGKSSEKISTIKSVTVASYNVNYGFSRSSDDDIWYTDIQQKNTSSAEEESVLLNGSFYVKKGKAEPIEFQTDVSSVKYFDTDGPTLVYTTAKPLDTETFSEATLYLKEGENEPSVIADDYLSQPVVAINKPQKGIVYLSNALSQTDENGYVMSPTFDLIFKPFEGEAITIDTGVAYVYNAEHLTSSAYDFYDYSLGKTVKDTLLYIKDNKIYITSDLTAPPEDSTLDFAQSSPPLFSEKMDKVAYLSDDGILSYRKVTGGSVGAETQIAENVSTYAMSNDGSKIAYVVTADEENPSNASVYLYNTKNLESTEIVQQAYPLVYFSANQDSV